jgi:hypothetical protein
MITKDNKQKTNGKNISLNPLYFKNKPLILQSDLGDNVFSFLYGLAELGKI